jgi:uncharacterized membrane protein
MSYSGLVGAPCLQVFGCALLMVVVWFVTVIVMLLTMWYTMTLNVSHGMAIGQDSVEHVRLSCNMSSC